MLISGLRCAQEHGGMPSINHVRDLRAPPVMHRWSAGLTCEPGVSEHAEATSYPAPSLFGSLREHRHLLVVEPGLRHRDPLPGNPGHHMVPPQRPGLLGPQPRQQ